MKFYEDMNPVKRRLMLIETVQGSLALEGMKDAAAEFDPEVLALKKELKKQREQIDTTLTAEAQTS